MWWVGKSIELLDAQTGLAGAGAERRKVGIVKSNVTRQIIEP